MLMGCDRSTPILSLGGGGYYSTVWEYSHGVKKQGSFENIREKGHVLILMRDRIM